MWPKSTVMQDIRTRGVSFACLDINYSSVINSVERHWDGSKSIRVPPTSVKQVSEASARKIVLERLSYSPLRDARDLYERVQLDKDVLQALARAGAFDRLHERRDALCLD